MITAEHLELHRSYELLSLTKTVRVSYILSPEGHPSGASLLAGPPAIPYGAGLRLVLSLLLLLLPVCFCPLRRTKNYFTNTSKCYRVNRDKL